jgi:hypothetical protein
MTGACRALIGEPGAEASVTCDAKPRRRALGARRAHDGRTAGAWPGAHVALAERSNVAHSGANTVV